MRWAALGLATLLAGCAGVEHRAPGDVVVPLRTISIRVAADDAMRARPGWEATIRSTVVEVSRLYERHFQIRWELLDIVPWSSGEGAVDARVLVRELRADVPRGPADVLVGFSGRDCVKRRQGWANVFAPEAVVMACRGSSVTLDQVLAHELGHLFGAFHVTDPRSVMAQVGTRASTRVDSQTLRVVGLMRTLDFARGVVSLTEAQKQQYTAIFEEGSAPEQHNNLAVAMLAFGARRAAEGALDEAVSLYRQALVVAPGLSDARRALGLALGMQRRFDEGIAELREAIRLDPTEAAPRATLGVLLVEQGKTAEGLLEYREALRLKNIEPDIRRGFSAVLVRAGRPDEAIAELRETIRLSPGFAEAHVDLGALLAAQDRRDEAVAALRRAIALRPGLARAHGVLGMALARQGLGSEAEAEFREALRLDPALAPFRVQLGTLLSHQRRLDEAVAEFREAVRLNPGSWQSRVHLAEALRRQGKGEEAVAEFREVVKLQPANGGVRYALAVTLAGTAKYREAWDAVHQARALGFSVPPDFVAALSARMPDPKPE